MLEAKPILSEDTTLAVALDDKLDQAKFISPGLNGLLRSAAFAPLASQGFLRVTGTDRSRWLNGMATNSIYSLSPGEGCYNFFLNAQGKIQGDATVFALEDSLLLQTDYERIPALHTMLDRFIIMDDVELHTMGRSAGLLVAGPRSVEALVALGLTVPPAPLAITHTSFAGAPVDVVHAHSPMVPRFQIWPSDHVVAPLAEALVDLGLPVADAEDLEHLRLLEGTPLYGTDIGEKDLPQETGQTRALHFAKGCYLGQEIVERIRSRGQVRRTLAGFVLSGEVPAPRTPLFVNQTTDSPVGELTSAASIQLPEHTVLLALGFVRREVLEQKLSYSSGTARVLNLPYRQSFT